METPSADYMRGWLRGFYDGEGWAVNFHGTRKSGKYAGKKTHTCEVGVGNTDKFLMERCADFLDALGVTSRYMLSETRDGVPFHRIHICSGDGLRQFADQIGFYSKDKQARLEAALAWRWRPDRGKGIRLPYNPPADELKRLYVDEGLGYVAICRRTGLSPKRASTVRRRLVENGIPLRKGRKFGS